MRLTRPIAGDKITLRTLDADGDLDAYLGWMSDPDVTRFLEARFRAYSLADIRDYVRACNESESNLLLGICLRADGRHLGNVKLGPIDRNHLRGDIGIMIGDKAAWGGGAATETLALLSQYAFGTLGLHKLTAGCYAGNAGAIRAFIKVGFVQAAVLPEHRRQDGQWVDQVLLHRIAGAGR